MLVTEANWIKACKVEDVAENTGACVLINGKQIAIFHFATLNKWYASQNLCPHKMQMILSRGILGTSNDEPKVACPYHKKTFSLESGQCLSGEDYSIETYSVKILDEDVYICLND